MELLNKLTEIVTRIAERLRRNQIFAQHLGWTNCLKEDVPFVMDGLVEFEAYPPAASGMV